MFGMRRAWEWFMNGDAEAQYAMQRLREREQEIQERRDRVAKRRASAQEVPERKAPPRDVPARRDLRDDFGDFSVHYDPLSELAKDIPFDVNAWNEQHRRRVTPAHIQAREAINEDELNNLLKPRRPDESRDDPFRDFDRDNLAERFRRTKRQVNEAFPSESKDMPYTDPGNGRKPYPRMVEIFPKSGKVTPEVEEPEEFGNDFWSELAAEYELGESAKNDKRPERPKDDEPDQSDRIKAEIQDITEFRRSKGDVDSPIPINWEVIELNDDGSIDWNSDPLCDNYLRLNKLNQQQNRKEDEPNENSDDEPDDDPDDETGPDENSFRRNGKSRH